MLWRCWLGHTTRKTVSEMTYNVLSGTLNPTMPYRTIPYHHRTKVFEKNAIWTIIGDDVESGTGLDVYWHRATLPLYNLHLVQSVTSLASRRHVSGSSRTDLVPTTRNIDTLVWHRHSLERHPRKALRSRTLESGLYHDRSTSGPLHLSHFLVTGLFSVFTYRSVWHCIYQPQTWYTIRYASI